MEQSKEKILVVEDNIRIAEMIARKLRKNGFEVITAGNGVSALEQINRIFPDLIILDILMPDMDGYDVKKELCKSEMTEYIPVIFLSGKNDLKDKIKGLGLGADDYITKPFKHEELLARVEAILRRKRYYEYISMHDGLTGLYNVTYFQREFNLFFNMAVRYKTPFSLAVIDVNNFKHINDTYGHKMGDRVLRNIADILKEALRNSDLLSRYGGDEFVILIPNLDPAKHDEFIKRIGSLVSSWEVKIEDSQSIYMSISIGVTAYTPGFKTRDEMFADADRKMYEHKQSLKAENV